MGEDPTRRNQSLYCTYHREKGHTTKQCQVLKDHLEQLVKAGHLKEFLVSQERVNMGQSLGSQANNMLPPPLGIIEVVHAVFKGVSMSHWKGMLNVVTPLKVDTISRPEKRPRKTSVPIMFNEEDLKGTSQPHDDTLVVTSRIGGFLVKRVLVDQGSGQRSCTLIFTRGWG